MAKTLAASRLGGTRYSFVAADGRRLVTLRRENRDGTTELRFPRTLLDAYANRVLEHRVHTFATKLFDELKEK